MTGNYRGAILSNNGCIELWRGDDGVPFIDFKTDYATDYDARIQKTATHQLTFKVGGSGSIVTALTLNSDGTCVTSAVRPRSDNTYDLGSSSYSWKDVYALNFLASGKITLNNNINIKWKDTGGTERNILRLDGANNIIFTNPAGVISLQYQVAKNIYFHVGTTTEPTTLASCAAADATNTMRNSAKLGCEAKYWDGSQSVARQSYMQHRMIDTTPKSELVFTHAGTDKFKIGDNGIVCIDDVKPDVDVTYDLGSASYRWKIGYFANSGTVLKLYGTSSSAVNPVIDFKEDGSSSYWQLGKRGSAFSGQPDYFFLSYYNGSSWNPHLYFTGTQILAAKTIRPSADDTHDLGQNEYRFRKLFISTAIDMQNSSTIRFRKSDGTDDNTLIYRAGGNALRIHYAANEFIIRNLDDTYSISFRDSGDTKNAVISPFTGVGYFKGLLPMADNTYDLGSSSYRWNEGFFFKVYIGTPSSGSHRGAFLSNDGQLELWRGDDGVPYIDFKTDYATDYDARIQKTSGHSLEFKVGGSGSIITALTLANEGTTITRNIRPFADNTYDLGSSSYRWRDIHAGGVVEVKHDGATLRSLTPSSANQTAGCGLSWQEEGSSTYWLMQKRGSQRATEPDYLFISYYDGSSWHQYLTLEAGNDNFKIRGDAIPAGDATWDLGSSSQRWRNLYLSTANSLLELLARHKGPFWFNSHWLPSGMMTYATTGSGTVSWYDNYVGLGTGTTSGSTVKTYKRFYGFNNTYSWDKKRVFGAEVYFSSYTNQVVWIVSGWITDITASSATDRHIGFKLVNGTLYGTVADGTTEATLTLETLSSDAHRTLEYVYTPGSEVRFYVDGVDKGAITTNLPSGTINALYALFASVYNSAAEQKRLNIYDIRVIQEE